MDNAKITASFMEKMAIKEALIMEVYRKKMTREEYMELRRMVYLDKVACLEYDHATQTCKAVLFADERAEKILQRAGFKDET